MSDAGLYSLLAVILAGCIAFFTSVYTIRKQQPGMDADSENDRASALEVYWKRIAMLESENERLKTKLREAETHYENEIRKLKIENSKLWAEIGQLKLRLS